MENKKLLQKLYSGLESVLDTNEFRAKKEKVLDDAFHKIINDTYEGKINWQRERGVTSDDECYFKASASIQNNKGEKMIIPVLFYTSDSDFSEIGFLHLIDKKGPCLNTEDKNLKNLAKDYFDFK